MKKMMAGYLVFRNGKTKMQGSVRCEMDDESKVAQEETSSWVKEFVRVRWNVPDTDEIRVVGFMPAQIQHAKAL